MFPKLFEIPSIFGLPPFPIHFYGVFLATAYFTAIAVASRRAPRDGMSPERIWDLSMWVLVSAIGGSKLLLFIVDPAHGLSLRTAGVFYGGFIAATIVSFWYIRKHGLPFWRVADITAPSIALGEGIGRIGCYTAGCCWGAPLADSGIHPAPWWHGLVTFTSQYAHDMVGVPINEPLWPTQLMLSANGFVLAIILLVVAARRRFEGQVFFTYVLLHSITRGLIETVRGDADRGIFFGLSTSQWIAVGTGTLAVVGLAWLGSRPPAEPPSGSGGTGDSKARPQGSTKPRRKDPVAKVS